MTLYFFFFYKDLKRRDRTPAAITFTPLNGIVSVRFLVSRAFLRACVDLSNLTFPSLLPRLPTRQGPVTPAAALRQRPTRCPRPALPPSGPFASQ